jgi:signal peptidase II
MASAPATGVGPRGPVAQGLAAWSRAVLVLAVVVAADQFTKSLVRGRVPPGRREDLFLGLDLVHVRNPGIAFGLLPDQGRLLTGLTLLALVVLLVYFARHASRRLLWLPTGLLLGGAAGNLVDRARLGAVTDFLDPPLWPAFNLADAAITVGILVLLVLLDLAREERA